MHAVAASLRFTFQRAMLPCSFDSCFLHTLYHVTVVRLLAASITLSDSVTSCVFPGEDFQVQLYNGGPPFKYTRALTEHTNFVNCVRCVWFWRALHTARLFTL